MSTWTPERPLSPPEPQGVPEYRCETCASEYSMRPRLKWCVNCHLQMCPACEENSIETSCEVCEQVYHAQCLPKCGCGCECRYCRTCEPMHREDQLELDNPYFLEQIHLEREAALERAYAERVLGDLFDAAGGSEPEIERLRR